jgi:RNA polymerase sigma-70 factor (ECF subfamily)
MRYTRGMRRRRAEPSSAADRPPADADDELTQLLVAARSDPDRLGEFFTREYPPVLRYLARTAYCPEIAADLAAETFAVVVRDIHRFDPARGSAGAWVRGIARNQLRTWMRRGVVDARARQRLRIVTPSFVDDEASLVHAGVDEAPARAAVRGALQSLSDADQRVIRLRVVDRLPYDEVAAELGCTSGAARVRSSRALARLRAAVEKEPAKIAGLA